MKEELKKKGLDPNKTVSDQEVKSILSTSTFKAHLRATARARCTGIKVLASFESNPASGKGQVGVIGVWTRKLHEVADAVVTGDYSLIPKGVPGLRIKQHIPEDLRTLLSTFGTQLLRDETGREVIDYSLDQYGRRKMRNPKLETAHQVMFQQKSNGQLHNALVDISVTLRVYLKLTLDIDICNTYDRTIKKQETVSNHNEICNIINPIPIIQPSKTTDYSGELITGFSDLPNDELEEKKIGVDSVIRETAVKTVYSIIKQSLKNVSKKIKPVDTDIIITICTAIIKSGKRKGETCGRPLNLCRYHKEKPKIFSRENIGKTSKIVPTEFGGKKNKTMKKKKKGKLYKRKS
jgi:hypothetical protein